jgi:CHAD domain-containing protein
MKKRWRDGSVQENLQRVLPRMTEKWFEAGAAALQPGKTWDEMHRFRLLTKRYRYTLEIFQPQYGPGLESRIKLLRNLQTYLGDINDCITAQQLLGPSDDGLHAALAERAQEKTSEMLKFWAQKFAGKEQMEAWKRYLERYAGRNRKLRSK